MSFTELQASTFQDDPTIPVLDGGKQWTQQTGQWSEAKL